jgi:Uma2 family endonuclease
MSAVAESIEPLVAGDKLTREEFLRRWEAMPQLKRAELIGGIVYMPSPLSWKHGIADTHAVTWLGTYAAFTPGCDAGTNTTWFMGEDVPQPDVHLWVLPEYGGQARLQGPYPRGAPELAAEVCLSRTAYDLHQKKDLYRSAGVQEYVAILLREREVRWHRLVGGNYELLPISSQSLIRSVIFPGLWLDVQPFLEGDMRRVLETLHGGLQSPEHAAFVAELARRKSAGLTSPATGVTPTRAKRPNSRKAGNGKRKKK